MAVSTLQVAGEVDPVQSARVDLAAAHRLGVLHSLEEGIDNHFTVTVPGHNDRYFFLPFGLHWEAIGYPLDSLWIALGYHWDSVGFPL